MLEEKGEKIIERSHLVPRVDREESDQLRTNMEYCSYPQSPTQVASQSIGSLRSTTRR